MQTRIEPGKCAKYHFDSIHEMSNWLTRTPAVWTRNHSSERDHGDRDWDLGVKYADALRMARDGWIEGAEAVQEALKAFPTKTPAPDTRTDVYGFRPHVPRFCAGAPDSMIRHTDVAETGAGKVLTIIVQVTMPAMTNATAAANYGVAVAQYINQMEMEGTRCEIIACQSLNQSYMAPHGVRVAFSCVVKNADQPLDLAVIAYTIGHPTVYRRLGFAALERSAAPESSTYLYPTGARVDDVINAPVGAVVLNGMSNIKLNQLASTAEKALEYVSQEIETALKDREL